MSRQSNKSTNGGKQKMIVASFRLPETALEAIKRKLGLIPHSKVFRILALKWLNGEIEITDDDIKKYSE